MIYTIDLNQFDQSYDKGEQELIHADSVKAYFNTSAWQVSRVWIDFATNTLYSTNKTTLRKAWAEYKKQNIQWTKELNLYHRDSELIEKTFKVTIGKVQ